MWGKLGEIAGDPSSQQSNENGKGHGKDWTWNPLSSPLTLSLHVQQ